MTQEEKQLLLKDLCARLPYGVICFAPDYEYGDIGKLWCIEPFEDLDPQITVQYPKGNTITKFCSEVKPYLRPMSSMTDEEWKEYNQTIGKSFSFTDEVDWLNKNMFDYRGLIEKGLAIESPDGMYGEKHEKPVEPKRIPATIEEALDILDDVLTEEDKEYLVKNGAISVHLSLGMWIRNEWKLWEPVDSDIKTYLKKEGYEHPDDMSNYIIEEFIKYLNNKL